MLGFPKWVAAGSVGGLVGAAVWAAITYTTNYEIGWIAWGIGFVVGVFVRFAAGEAEEGLAPGLTAAIIAILAVLGGKYAAVHMLVSHELDSVTEIAITEEDMIVSYADEIINEREAKGQKVVLPGGKTIEMASSKADYPPAIWKQASAKWNKLSADEKAKQLEVEQASTNAVMAGMVGSVRQDAFTGSFSPFDALWFFLAAATAFKLGSGTAGSDD